MHDLVHDIGLGKEGEDGCGVLTITVWLAIRTVPVGTGTRTM
jgi:hypothetical protein